MTKTEKDEATEQNPRNVTLGMILKYITGDEEEPLLGYHVSPTTLFVKAATPRAIMPTSNTCINTLNLPRQVPQLPKAPPSSSDTNKVEEGETEFSREDLFEHDLAFLTDFFRKV